MICLCYGGRITAKTEYYLKDDPAPLVDREIKSLTLEQVSEVYKFVYFTMGVPYEDIGKAILDEDIAFYWKDLENFKEKGQETASRLIIRLFFQNPNAQ